ncbi:MAG: hypothetical protein WB870_16140 [Gallionellaceae bacterium]
MHRGPCVVVIALKNDTNILLDRPCAIALIDELNLPACNCDGRCAGYCMRHTLAAGAQAA